MPSNNPFYDINNPPSSVSDWLKVQQDAAKAIAKNEAEGLSSSALTRANADARTAQNAAAKAIKEIIAGQEAAHQQRVEDIYLGDRTTRDTAGDLNQALPGSAAANAQLRNNGYNPNLDGSVTRKNIFQRADEFLGKGYDNAADAIAGHDGLRNRYNNRGNFLSSDSTLTIYGELNQYLALQQAQAQGPFGRFLTRIGLKTPAPETRIADFMDENGYFKPDAANRLESILEFDSQLAPEQRSHVKKIFKIINDRDALEAYHEALDAAGPKAAFNIAQDILRGDIGLGVALDNSGRSATDVYKQYATPAGANSVDHFKVLGIEPEAAMADYYLVNRARNLKVLEIIDREIAAPGRGVTQSKVDAAIKKGGLDALLKLLPNEAQTEVANIIRASETLTGELEINGKRVVLLDLYAEKLAEFDAKRSFFSRKLDGSDNAAEYAAKAIDEAYRQAADTKYTGFNDDGVGKQAAQAQIDEIRQADIEQRIATDGLILGLEEQRATTLQNHQAALETGLKLEFDYIKDLGGQINHAEKNIVDQWNKLVNDRNVDPRILHVNNESELRELITDNQTAKEIAQDPDFVPIKQGLDDQEWRHQEIEVAKNKIKTTLSTGAGDGATATLNTDGTVKIENADFSHKVTHFDEAIAAQKATIEAGGIIKETYANAAETGAAAKTRIQQTIANTTEAVTDAATKAGEAIESVTTTVPLATRAMAGIAGATALLLNNRLTRSVFGDKVAGLGESINNWKNNLSAMDNIHMRNDGKYYVEGPTQNMAQLAEIQGRVQSFGGAGMMVAGGIGLYKQVVDRNSLFRQDVAEGGWTAAAALGQMTLNATDLSGGALLFAVPKVTTALETFSVSSGLIGRASNAILSFESTGLASGAVLGGGKLAMKVAHAGPVINVLAGLVESGVGYLAHDGMRTAEGIGAATIGTGAFIGSTALAGMASGAAAGMIGGPIGAVVGGAVGLIVVVGGTYLGSVAGREVVKAVAGDEIQEYIDKKDLVRLGQIKEMLRSIEESGKPISPTQAVELAEIQDELTTSMSRVDRRITEVNLGNGRIMSWLEGDNEARERARNTMYEDYSSTMQRLENIVVQSGVTTSASNTQGGPTVETAYAPPSAQPTTATAPAQNNGDLSAALAAYIRPDSAPTEPTLADTDQNSILPTAFTPVGNVELPNASVVKG